MIKVVKGTYGHREGRKIILKTEKDGPFKATPEQEQRLVDLGVAIYVGESKSSISASLESNQYSMKMKLDDLKEVAKLYGVDASKARKKADVIEMIENAKSPCDQDDTDVFDNTGDEDSTKNSEQDDMDNIEDGEEPPTISPADPVE